MERGLVGGLGGMMVPGLDLERSNDRLREMMANIPTIWETQARLYMEGLKAQADALAETLGPQQEVVMNCWHGTEKLAVLRVSLPSENVVALHCVDTDGNTVQVTGHMNSLTFSFRVQNIVPPAIRRPIGFIMPQGD